MPRLDELPITLIAGTQVWTVTFYGLEYWFHLYHRWDYAGYALNCYNPRNTFEGSLTFLKDGDIFDAMKALLASCFRYEDVPKREWGVLTPEEQAVFLDAGQKLNIRSWHINMKD